MGQFVEETAHLKTDKKKFDEGWERIFGKKSHCQCERFTINNSLIKGKEVICADCGRVMTAEIKREQAIGSF